MRIDRQSDGSLQILLSGSWILGSNRSRHDLWLEELETALPVEKVIFKTDELAAWDSGLLNFLQKILQRLKNKGIESDLSGLPQGVQRLIELASAVPERKGARRGTVREFFLVRVGGATLDFGRSAVELLEFIGESAQATWRLFLGKARFRRSDFIMVIKECGVGALPVVMLINLLVGLILAFVGAVMLQMFGAGIYVALLVGFAMVRVMGAIMTGIIMAGRTGAAFAAQLGTMQVNEEIDALKTMGISPMEFLVLPRMVAMALMMPLLCLYADLMGILGGFIVGIFMLDLSVMEYYNMTVEAVGLTDLFIGLFHSLVFGVLVALSGCLKGIRCGRSASAVGSAVTSAVVSGIISIIVATAIITVACYVINI
jgi:phospholipid/cholesterol/gamma-HCH transport system permease protein